MQIASESECRTGRAAERHLWDEWREAVEDAAAQIEAYNDSLK